jgi:hypothetical protein
MVGLLIVETVFFPRFLLKWKSLVSIYSYPDFISPKRSEVATWMCSMQTLEVYIKKGRHTGKERGGQQDDSSDVGDA